MNNNFSGFVKKSKLLVLSKLIIVVLVALIVVPIAIATIPILVIFYSLLLVGIVFSTKANIKRSQIVKYKLGMDVDNNIYMPLVLDNDYLNKIFSEFNNAVEMPSNVDNLVSYVQYMIDNMQMIFVQKKFKLEDVIDLLNNLMYHQNIDYSLDINDIIKTDDEIISLRRKNNIINDFHDLAIIRTILESNKLELIKFFAPNDGFSKLVRIGGHLLAVVPINKVETLKKYQIELANKFNYIL